MGATQKRLLHSQPQLLGEDCPVCFEAVKGVTFKKDGRMVNLLVATRATTYAGCVACTSLRKQCQHGNASIICDDLEGVFF